MAIYGDDKLHNLRSAKPFLVPEIIGFQQMCDHNNWRSDQDVRFGFVLANKLPDGTWQFPLSDGTIIVAHIQFRSPTPSDIIVLSYV